MLFMSFMCFFLTSLKKIRVIWYDIIYNLPKYGGYHSKSLINCYIFSTLKIIFVLNSIYYINVYKINTFFITLISSIVILFLSPVECKNKRLDQDEKKVYKNKSMRVTLFIYLICLLVYFTNNYISTTFSVSIFVVAFLTILGKIDSNLITKRY